MRSASSWIERRNKVNNAQEYIAKIIELQDKIKELEKIISKLNELP
jgi:hypothetical protein